MSKYQRSLLIKERITRREQQHGLHVDTTKLRSVTLPIHAAKQHRTRNTAQTMNAKIDKENKVDKRRVVMVSPRERERVRSHANPIAGLESPIVVQSRVRSVSLVAGSNRDRLERGVAAQVAIRKGVW